MGKKKASSTNGAGITGSLDEECKQMHIYHPAQNSRPSEPQQKTRYTKSNRRENEDQP